MPATLLTLLIATLVTSVPPAPSPVDAVRAAPHLPDWLPPPEPFVRVDTLHDVAGLRVALDGADGEEHVFFVWDWAWVRLRDGRIVSRRLELVDEHGGVYSHDASDHPDYEGAVPIETWSELLGTGVVSVTDENGVLRHVSHDALSAGGISELDPPSLIIGHGACWLRPIHHCPGLRFDCPLTFSCVRWPNGTCACQVSVHPEQRQLCPLEVVGHACVKSSRCAGRCVAPCVCEVPSGGGGDDE